MSMRALFSRLTQQAARPLTKAAPTVAHTREQTDAALELARELLHAVEQFVISTPDMDTQRFLHRTRSTAAGLTAKADAPTLHLYSKWAAQSLRVFGNLQRRYVAEREDEMWRLLETYRQVAEVGHTRSDRLNAALEESHRRMLRASTLDDLRSMRETMEEELKVASRLVEQKTREDKDRIAQLSLQVSRLEATLASVRGQANYDVLTGIYHRSAWHDRLHQFLGAGKPCSLAFIDVDNFKTINDTLGHQVGDRILAMLADQLRRVGRSGDVIGRFGGDEFCFVAPGFTQEQLAQRIAGAVARRHVRIDLEESVCQVLLSASIGIARSVLGDTPESLIERADQAMRVAKKEGKGGIRLAR